MKVAKSSPSAKHHVAGVANSGFLDGVIRTFQLLGSIASVGAIVLAAIEYFFHVAIFYNPTEEYMSRYAANVTPLLVAGGQFVTEHLVDLKKNDPDLFGVQIRNFARDNNLHGKLSVGVDVLEDIIDCHQRFTCRIDGYARLESSIRNYWYDYSPVLLDMRGTEEPKDFGVRLQAEAKRILDQDREKGTLPK